VERLVVEVFDGLEGEPPGERVAAEARGQRQPSLRLDALQPQPDVDRLPGHGLHDSEGAPRRDQRDVRLARLDLHVLEAADGHDHGVEDRAQGGPVGVLGVDQLLGRRGQECRSTRTSPMRAPSPGIR
jgi:hypothetical protein